MMEANMQRQTQYQNNLVAGASGTANLPYIHILPIYSVEILKYISISL